MTWAAHVRQLRVIVNRLPQWPTSREAGGGVARRRGGAILLAARERPWNFVHGWRTTEARAMALANCDLTREVF